MSQYFYSGLNQLQPALLLLFVTYLLTLLIIVISFVPGAGENLVRFLVGLKKAVHTEPRSPKLNRELVGFLKSFFRDKQIPLIIKLLALLIGLTFVLAKLFLAF